MLEMGFLAQVRYCLVLLFVVGSNLQLALGDSNKTTLSPTSLLPTARSTTLLLGHPTNKTGDDKLWLFPKPTISTTTTTTTTRTTITAAPICTCGNGAKPVATSAVAVADEKNIIMDVANDPKIIQGVVSGQNAWPWIAALVDYTNPNAISQQCGGSLINSWYILTAAHCVQDIVLMKTSENFRIHLGSNSIHKPDPNRIVLRIGTITMHPRFNTATDASTVKDFDFALIRLATPVTFSKIISPVCLDQTGNPFAGRNAIVAGWGLVQPNAAMGSEILREVALKVMTQQACTKAEIGSPIPISDRMMCAIGSPATKGFCNGDSGGPLMVFKPVAKTFTQVGVVSFGNCEQNGVPGVFTRVSRLLNFIRSTTQGTQFCSNSFSA